MTPSQAWLLAVFGSGVSLVALAQSLMSTALEDETTTVIVARAPASKSPMLQVTTPPTGKPQLPVSVLIAPKLKLPSLR